jgi:MFS family permease
MTCATASLPAATASLPTARLSLPPRAMTVFGVLAAMAFGAGGGAPTPLYRLYQESFGLTPAVLTVIFAAYVFSLLGALLTVGSLSDHIGRRPVIFAALSLNAVAMLMFIRADSAAALVAARIVQGFATGAATTTLSAAILDTNRTHGPLFNSITAFAGLTLGSIGSAALVTYAPAPAQLIYVVLLMVSASLALILWQMPETAEGKPGAWASLLPHVSVPQQARQTLLRVTPVNIAAWALGGFYFSLMPSLVRVATGLASPIIGGVVVAALTFAAVVAVVVLRKWPADRILAFGTSVLALGVVVTLAGVRLQQAPVLLVGTAVAGFGFGAAFSGTLRTVLPLAAAGERAGLLSAFYVQSYLAFSLPAIVAGLLAPVLGLPLSTYIYGSVIILLAATSLVAIWTARPKPSATKPSAAKPSATKPSTPFRVNAELR